MTEIKVSSSYAICQAWRVILNYQKFIKSEQTINSHKYNTYTFYNIYIYIIYIYIYRMGALASRLGRQNVEQNNQSLRPSRQSSQQSMADTAYGVWQRSSKTTHDFITYIQSQQSHDQNHERALLFVSSITNRQKLYTFLQQIQSYILNLSSNAQTKCKLTQDDRKHIINVIHPKLANIWFIWNQLQSPNLTPSLVHDKMLNQITTGYSYAQKLIILYGVFSSSPALPLHSSASFIESDTIVKQAIRTNYPYMITKESIGKLFEHIIEVYVYIEDSMHFCKFIRSILEINDTKRGRQLCSDYVERLYSIYRTDQEYEHVRHYLQKLSSSSSSSASMIIQAGRVFLQVGYPHAMQLIFSTVLDVPECAISEQQLRLYLYTRMYSLFSYWLEDINLQYKHVQKMTISNIIHLMLRNNNADVLAKLAQVFKDVKGIQQSKLNQKMRQNNRLIYNFQDELSEYIFSTYCSLQMCLQIIAKNPSLVTIDNAHPQRQLKLITKLSQSKFQVIIQNQQLIKSVIQRNLSSNSSYKLKQLSDKIQQVLQITRLLYMFGVNEKFNCITVFYCPQTQMNFQSQPSQKQKQKQIQILQQQKALHLYKSFISKYYISNLSNDKNRKIMLNSKSNNPINVDLNKSQAILQISQYLYDKLLKKGLHSIKQIHQIIFQHMIYFYRYDDAKNILTNDTLINKYGINIEMLEMIVVDNIVESIKKTSDTKKIINDINQQLKLIKNNQSVEAQGAKALVKLIAYLSQNGIQLAIEDKEKMNINLMYNLIRNYGDRIDVLNFDTIYEEIRAINSNEHIASDEKFTMTNQLLKFKSKLAAKAFELGKKKLGNQLIDQISRFDPPWLTTQLIEIFHNTNSKIDKRIYGIALKSCSKGSDLKYLMELWKEQEGKQRRKQKGFADITEYFQTGREYLIIDDSLIQNEQKYRNYVAECQFSDSILHLKKYQLFFVLLGSEPDRAFHYALKVELDPFKIDTFLKQGMKTNIISPFDCLNYLHKYLFYAYQIQQQKLKPKDIIKYSQYLKEQFNLDQLRNNLKKLNKIKDKSIICQIYIKALSAYLFSKAINQRFINTYFTNSQDKGKSNLIFQLLFDEKSRKSLLIGLREQPMGRSDIFILNQVCNQLLGVSLVELSIFSLANIANTSQELDEKSENIMQKIITISSDKRQQCIQIVSKLVQKIFSVHKLLQILKYMKERENPIYKQIIKDKNLFILQQLSSIQLGQEFHGIIPTNFFENQINFNPNWPISPQHQKALRKCWAKTNIFVLSKVMYFIYGMNPEVERQIWTDYLQQNPDDELKQIKQKLMEHM